MCKKNQFKYCPSKIDPCMSRLIKLLELFLKKGYKTVGCCCGHGKYPMTLLVKSNGVVIDFFSGKIIPRKKRFYKRDREGYYYIPESIKRKV